MRGRMDDLVAQKALILGELRVQEDHQTLGGNVTLTDGDKVIAQFDAGGSARDITMPTRAATNDGALRLIINCSTDTETLVIKTATGATILTLMDRCAALMVATGSTEAPGTRAWYPLILPGGDREATITNTTGTLGNTNAAVSAIIAALQSKGLIA